MNFNLESHTNIKKLITLIRDIQKFINAKHSDLKITSNDFINDFFIQVLERFDINLIAIENLLEVYKSIPKIKLPLSLILRSINSDSLTILYLSTFLDKEKLGVNNELNIFQRDYIKFMEEFGKEELDFNIKYFQERTESIEKSKFHLYELHKDYPELYKKVNKAYSLKSNYELRQSTPEFLFPDITERKRPHGFISEAYKYKRLKLIDSDRYGAQAYLLFKYYSQFQHISPVSSKMLGYNNKILDDKFLLMSIENAIIGTNLILKVVTGDGDKSEIEIFISKLIELVN